MPTANSFAATVLALKMYTNVFNASNCVLANNKKHTLAFKRDLTQINELLKIKFLR